MAGMDFEVPCKGIFNLPHLKSVSNQSYDFSLDAALYVDRSLNLEQDLLLSP